MQLTDVNCLAGNAATRSLRAEDDPMVEEVEDIKEDTDPQEDGHAS